MINYSFKILKTVEMLYFHDGYQKCQPGSTQRRAQPLKQHLRCPSHVLSPVQLLEHDRNIARDRYGQTPGLITKTKDGFFSEASFNLYKTMLFSKQFKRKVFKRIWWLQF